MFLGRARTSGTFGTLLFHIFSGVNMENTSALIFSKTPLSFGGNFIFFSLAQGPPRDLQIISYKYDSAHAHNRLAEFSCKYDTTHA